MAETSFSLSGTSSVKEQTHNIDHASDLLPFANKSRQDGRFNDIIIRIGEKNIPANKMVLSCYSKYFDTMFNTEMEEKYKDVVELQAVDAESVEKLVDFMYTGKININTNNVCDLLAVSDFLQMLSVKKLCIEYLLTTITQQNCLTIQALADRFTIPKLTEKFNNYVVEKYQQVISDDHFKKLSKDDVIKLLQLTHDKVSSDLVYTAVMNWVKFDLASNESYLSELFKFVDISKVSPKMLEDVISVEPLIRKLDDWGNLFVNALVQQKKETTEKSLISLGGIKSLNKVTKFDLQTMQWSPLPDLPVRRSSASAVVIDDILYHLAGDLNTDGKETATNIVHRMKLKEKVLKWEKVASMNVERYVFGAAVINGVIFVFGGGDENNKRVSSGEYYVVPLNKWIQLKPMKIARWGHCLVAHNDQLYSLGGHDGQQVISSVERYDPSSDEWKDVASMQTPRRWFAAVVLNNAIYAIGGYDGKQTLKSVEKYNVDDDTWVYVENMNIERSSHAACVAQNKIYVVGGLDSGKKIVKSIECYDDQTDKWSVVGETEVELFNHSMVAI
uniref:kelch-like protein 12 isoform X1 n=1 Tax=Ciona intestinalis TaxID=7719 RepID=UPI000180C607|nr:kelch-like protein 12 isoform X1 [Ciona intestinalis]|eukprot:XP_018671835.1 kelch-like protein 12 isoform X1 [Ciona intestinalis]